MQEDSISWSTNKKTKQQNKIKKNLQRPPNSSLLGLKKKKTFPNGRHRTRIITTEE
jgi:hypothetical protein